MPELDFDGKPCPLVCRLGLFALEAPEGEGGWAPLVIRAGALRASQAAAEPPAPRLYEANKFQSRMLSLPRGLTVADGWS